MKKNGQGVNFVGTIVQRSISDGTLRYRAEIRVHRKDYPIFRESKTFNSRRRADSWLKKREVEIEANPKRFVQPFVLFELELVSAGG